MPSCSSRHNCSSPDEVSASMLPTTNRPAGSHAPSLRRRGASGGISSQVATVSPARVAMLEVAGAREQTPAVLGVHRGAERALDRENDARGTHVVVGDRGLVDHVPALDVDPAHHARVGVPRGALPERTHHVGDGRRGRVRSASGPPRLRPSAPSTLTCRVSLNAIRV